MPKITLFFDGSCEPQNPGGNMGFGIVIKSDAETIHTDNGFVPASKLNSNNVAEYSALVLGLKWLSENGHLKSQVECRGDSMLVVNQMAGEWRAKGGLYITKFHEAKELATKFKNISFRWIPRDQNFEADQLSRSTEPT